MDSAALTFWIATTFVAYVYAGYPLVIALLVRVWPAPDGCRPVMNQMNWPSVAVVVAVHNATSNVLLKRKRSDKDSSEKNMLL